MKRQAFSLTEVLLATTVIAVVASVLAPALPEVRPRPVPRPSRCQTNLKQLWVAMRLYAQDYDETWVGAYAYPNTWGQCPMFTWADLIYPYLYTTRYFACPDLPQRVLVRESGRSHCPPIASLYGVPLGQEPGTPLNPLPFGYLFNESYNYYNQFCNRCVCYEGLDCYHGMTHHSYYDPYYNDTTMDVGVKLSDVEDPTNTIVIADANPNCDRSILASAIASFYSYPRDADVEYDSYGNSYVGVGCYIGGRKMGRVDKRHREGANFLFVDGHTRWLYQTAPNMWTRYAD